MLLRKIGNYRFTTWAIIFGLFWALAVHATVILYESDEGESSTSEVTWQDKLVVTRTIEDDGEYLLWYSAELAGQLTNKAVACRAILDGVELSQRRGVPNNSASWLTFAGMKGVSLSAGEHTFKIQWAAETAAQTATIRRARVTVHKH